MVLKMQQIIDFPGFFEKVKSQKLPFKVAYRLTLLAKEIEKHINFYQESFRGLLLEFGKKDEDGNLVPTSDGQGIQLAPDSMDAAYEKLSELQELEVSLPDTKFSLSDFETVELSTEEIYVIIPFIEE